MGVIIIKTVYFFGAGASAADKAPTIGSFLKVSYEYFKDDKLILPLWSFIEEYYHCNLSNVKDIESELPMIDEIISTIDWALANNISLLSSYGPKETLRLQNSLTQLLSNTLKKSVAQVEDTLHDKLIYALKGSGKKYDLDLVSLNYDTLLEDAISNNGETPYYGLKKRKPSTGIRLYKLHGSINWALCPFCQQIKVLSQRTGVTKCKECSSPNLLPVLVTPTMLKSYNIPDLSRIWSEAFQSISVAEKLVFIGYSLPPADFAIIELIKRAIHMGGVLKEIHVVDLQQSVVERYRKIFGKRVIGHLDGFQGKPI